MPIYEYQCQNCQHRFEEIQKFSDSVLLSCPECQQPRLQRLVSSSAFHLKGEGWYLTESRNESKKGAGTVADKGGDNKGGNK